MAKLKLEKIGVELDEVVPYTLIENYLFDIKNLAANKKLFLLMLRRYAGADKKPAFPSYNKLMEDIGVSKRNVISKNIDFFVWIKWLERINRTSKDGEKLTNYYILSLKNVKMVLEHFEKKKYNFNDIEKHFETEYKNKATREVLLSKPCKYLL